MNKQYVTFGIIGIVAGLVLGFFVGNSMSAGGAGGPSATNTNETSASVNSSGGSTAQLPPDHPPITPGQTAPARPLTEQEMASTTPSAATSPTPTPPATSAGTSGHFPSLQPLAASSKEERAEKKYKNIQLLTGVAADNIIPIMNSFRSALGVACNYCHVSNSPDDAHKDDNPKKQIARNMIKLMRKNNADFFGGVQKVNCNTCHQGKAIPEQ